VMMDELDGSKWLWVEVVWSFGLEDTKVGRERRKYSSESSSSSKFTR
jgi:hypothetical protein